MGASQLEVVFALLEHNELIALLFLVEGLLLEFGLQRHLKFFVLYGFSSHGHPFLPLQHLGFHPLEEAPLRGLSLVREGAEVQR